MHIKALYMETSDRYGIDCDAYQSHKQFFTTYEEAQEWIHQNVSSYYTPFRMALLEEGFDWNLETNERRGGVGILVLTVWDKSKATTETLLFSATNVYIMNETGATIDRIRIN